MNTYYLDHNKEGAFWGDHVNIGQVLDRCYSWGILTQPSSRDLDTYKEHVRDLIHAMTLMNLWQFIDTYYLQDIDSVDEIRRMKMSELTEYIGDDEMAELWESQPKSENTSFRCHELSLESLKKIGKLKIEWTEFLYEHLV